MGRSLLLLLVVAEATWVGCSELVACLGGIKKCLYALLSELVLGSLVTCVGFATLGTFFSLAANSYRKTELIDKKQVLPLSCPVC